MFLEFHNTWSYHTLKITTLYENLIPELVPSVSGDSRFRRTTVGKMLLLANKRFFSMLFATFDANYWRPYITRLSTVISSCGLCVDV